MIKDSRVVFMYTVDPNLTDTGLIRTPLSLLSRLLESLGILISSKTRRTEVSDWLRGDNTLIKC